MLPLQRDTLYRLHWDPSLAEMPQRIEQLQQEIIRLAEAKTQAQVQATYAITRAF